MLPFGVLSQIDINDVVTEAKFGLPQVLIMILFIIVGFFFTFAGNQFLKPTLAIAGFVSLGFLSRSLLGFFDDDITDWTYLWTFIVAGFFAIIISYFLVNLGLAILGAFGGFSLAVFRPVLINNENKNEKHF